MHAVCLPMAFNCFCSKVQRIKPQISLPDGAITMNSLSIYKTIFAGGLAQGENAICNPGGRGAASPPVILYLNRAI